MGGRSVSALSEENRDILDYVARSKGASEDPHGLSPHIPNPPGSTCLDPSIDYPKGLSRVQNITIVPYDPCSI